MSKFIIIYLLLCYSIIIQTKMTLSTINDDLNINNNDNNNDAFFLSYRKIYIQAKQATKIIKYFKLK